MPWYNEIDFWINKQCILQTLRYVCEIFFNLEVYLLLSLVLTCVLTLREYGGVGSGTPNTTVEPSAPT